MKALLYTAPEKLEIKDVEEPVPSKKGMQCHNEVVIKVEACGICGSDMHAYLGHDERRPAPLILGHEVSGTVLSTGAKVAVNPLVTCGQCKYCLQGKDNLCQTREIISMAPRQGGFAEKIVIPERNLIPVPDGFPLEFAALIEPMACGWHAIRLSLGYLSQNPYFKTTDVSAIILGGGAIGVGAVLALQSKGIKNMHVLEPNSVRHENLLTLGVKVLSSEKDPGTYELIVDSVGVEKTRELASNMAMPGAVIAHIGLGSALGGLNVRRMTLQEIGFIGTYTYTSTDFKETAEMIFARDINQFEWVEKRHLSDGAQAFKDIRRGRVSAAKILLKP